MFKKISRFTFAFVLGFIIIFSTPVLVFGAGLVPVCNTTVDPVTGAFSDPCDFNMLMTIINNVITYLLVILATPLFAIIIVYTGWLYLSSGGSTENVTKAKGIFKNALVGYVIALAAWLIVKTILVTLGFTGPMFLS
jgi:hypothetical protein